MAQLSTDFLTHSPLHDLGLATWLAGHAAEATFDPAADPLFAATRKPGLDEEEEDLGEDEELEDDDELEDDEVTDDEDDEEEFEDDEDEDEYEDEEDDDEDDDEDEDEEEEEDDEDEVGASSYRLSDLGDPLQARFSGGDDDEGDLGCGVAEDEFTDDDMDTDRVASPIAA